MKFILIKIKKLVLFILIVLFISGCCPNINKLDNDNKTLSIRTDCQTFTCQVPFQLHGLYERDYKIGNWIDHISLFDNRITLSIDVNNNLKENIRENFSGLDYLILTYCIPLETTGILTKNDMVFRDEFINKEITTKNNKKIQVAFIYMNQDSLNFMKINAKHLIVALVNDNIGYRIHLTVKHYEPEDEKIFEELLNSLDFIEEN